MSENPRTTANDGQATGLSVGAIWDILVNASTGRLLRIIDGKGAPVAGALVSICESGQDESQARIVGSDPYGFVSLAGFSPEAGGLQVRVLAKGTAHAQPSSPPPPSSAPPRSPEPAPSTSASPSPPVSIDESLTEYHNPNGGTRWRLTSEGIDVEHVGHLRTDGEPKTMIQLWDDFGEDILAASGRLNVPVDVVAAMITIEAARVKHGENRLSFDPRSDRKEPGYTSDEETPHRRSPGLMQTLITTAREMARKYKLLEGQVIDTELLFNPTHSILLGAAYIAHQIGKYGVDPPLLCGAYNAGGVYQHSENEFKIRTYGATRMPKFISYFNDFHAAIRQGSINLPSGTLTSLPSGGGTQQASAPATQPAAAKPSEEATQPAASNSRREEILALYAHLDPQRIIKDRQREELIVYFHENKSRFQNQDVISVIDFSVNRSKKRWHFIDMKTGAVDSVHVAHGKKSETTVRGMATEFSNDDGSNMSSLGFYKGAEVYKGANEGDSLKLDGLSPTNSNARARYIVVHGAAYVTSSGAGRSEGCPAVSHADRQRVIHRIKNGSLIYASQ